MISKDEGADPDNQEFLIMDDEVGEINGKLMIQNLP